MAIMDDEAKLKTEIIFNERRSVVHVRDTDGGSISTQSVEAVLLYKILEQLLYISSVSERMAEELDHMTEPHN